MFKARLNFCPISNKIFFNWIKSTPGLPRNMLQIFIFNNFDMFIICFMKESSDIMQSLRWIASWLASCTGLWFLSYSSSSLMCVIFFVKMRDEESQRGALRLVQEKLMMERRRGTPFYIKWRRKLSELSWINAGNTWECYKHWGWQINLLEIKFSSSINYENFFLASS